MFNISRLNGICLILYIKTRAGTVVEPVDDEMEIIEISLFVFVKIIDIFLNVRQILLDEINLQNTINNIFILFSFL
jgi:hypothetical protein